MKIFIPKFNSKLVNLIFELEKLKNKKLGGTTHPLVFFQLKEIFHTMESIGSARIEGNNTTIAEYFEREIERNNKKDEKFIEILNSKKALTFIDKNIDTLKIDKLFISEIHKIVVDGLSPPPQGEGSNNPGEYRKLNPKINKSKHRPIDYAQVSGYMDDLIDFINEESDEKYNLIKVALVHHKFVWIHPFDNGNGRVVRLLTYAMLIKYGYNINVGRIINPTAIFCSDREKYYNALASVDKFHDKDIEKWCEYVLSGLKREVGKTYKLADYRFLKENILIPALEVSLEKKIIKEDEFKILKIAVEKQVFQLSDIVKCFPKMAKVSLSRKIKRLKDKKMILSETKNSRKYVLCFNNNYLYRGIIRKLDENNFLPIKGETIA